MSERVREELTARQLTGWGESKAVAATIWIGPRRRRKFAEAFLAAHADSAVVETLRKIFARKQLNAGESAGR